jgi:hypothetical protein
MKRSLIALLALVITILPAAAFAEGKEAKAKGSKKFPMTAQEFKAKTGEKITKAKAKMEDRIKSGKMSEERAKVVRARFESVSTKVTKVIAKVTADGSVTREEYKEVSQVANEARREAARTIKVEKKAKSDKSEDKKDHKGHAKGDKHEKKAQ